ncbi:hypothetical protein GGE67_001370 [Rhizobium leucaenae]|nr:hypothetical protein [Rhizobium leucaenae]
MAAAAGALLLRGIFAGLHRMYEPAIIGLMERPPAGGRSIFVGDRYALKKASRSALMTSAWVVAMPCGKPL